MPLKLEYADDVDFLDEEKLPLETLQPIAAKYLKEFNLNMNETKTEFTHVFLADADEIDAEGQPNPSYGKLANT